MWPSLQKIDALKFSKTYRGSGELKRLSNLPDDVLQNMVKGFTERGECEALANWCATHVGACDKNFDAVKYCWSLVLGKIRSLEGKIKMFEDTVPSLREPSFYPELNKSYEELSKLTSLPVKILEKVLGHKYRWKWVKEDRDDKYMPGRQMIAVKEYGGDWEEKDLDPSENLDTENEHIRKKYGAENYYPKGTWSVPNYTIDPTTFDPQSPRPIEGILRDKYGLKKPGEFAEQRERKIDAPSPRGRSQSPIRRPWFGHKNSRGKSAKPTPDVSNRAGGATLTRKTKLSGTGKKMSLVGGFSLRSKSSR